MLPFWQRLLVTLIAMLASSFVVGLIWRSVLNFDMPPYLGGLVGGVVSLPLWALLKRIRPRGDEDLDR